MNYFLNYKNKELSVNTYRLPDAVATDVDDIKSAFNKRNDEILTASLNDWVKENSGQLENDVLELVFDDFAIDLSIYPELLGS